VKESKIEERFTVHGLRRTFNDLTRRAGVDGVVIKSLTGHVTEKMRTHYSTVGLDEKLAKWVDAIDVDRITLNDSPTEAVAHIRDTTMRDFGLTYRPRAKPRWYLGER
jgi:hypothetical protein